MSDSDQIVTEVTWVVWSLLRKAAGTLLPQMVVFF